MLFQFKFGGFRNPGVLFLSTFGLGCRAHHRCLSASFILNQRCPRRSLQSLHLPTPTEVRCVQNRQFHMKDAFSGDNAIASDDGAWNAYQEAMTPIVDDIAHHKSSAKKIKEAEFDEVRDYLLSAEPQTTVQIGVEGGVADEFRQILSSRKKHFLSVTNFTSPQYDLAMRCLVNLVAFCAKTKSVMPVVIAWSKIKSSGMVLKPSFLSSLLFVAGLEDGYHDISLEIATCHDLLYGPTESSIFLRIKSLVTMKDLESAEALLNELPDYGKECKRLRTFMPILKHYCGLCDTYSILKVLKLIRAAPGAHIDSSTYVLIIGALARNASFGLQTRSVGGPAKLSLSRTGGPELLNQIMCGMKEDILDISEEGAVKLHNDFKAGFRTSGEYIPRDMVPYATDSVDGWEPDTNGLQMFVGRVNVDAISAICPCTGAKLHLHTLDQGQRQLMRDTLFEMAESQQKEFSAGRRQGDKKHHNSGDAKLELRKFEEWLQNRKGGAFTAFVDGANVAYFGQGHVRYSQVLKVVEELERLGERPLVVMPRKYVNSSFRLGHGVVQQLTAEDLKVVTRLINEKKMYIVPAQCFDDYYWMLASITEQKTETASLHSSPNCTSVLPGIRPILVSNDQMRDHKLELLEPHLFRRWCSSHIVTYSISPFQENEWENRYVRFAAADSFSCEIQGNAIARKGMDGTAWHFPVSEWEPRTSRFCIAFALPQES